MFSLISWCMWVAAQHQSIPSKFLVAMSAYWCSYALQVEFQNVCAYVWVYPLVGSVTSSLVQWPTSTFVKWWFHCLFSYEIKLFWAFLVKQFTIKKFYSDIENIHLEFLLHFVYINKGVCFWILNFFRNQLQTRFLRYVFCIFSNEYYLPKHRRHLFGNYLQKICTVR